MDKNCDFSAHFYFLKDAQLAQQAVKAKLFGEQETIGSLWKDLAQIYHFMKFWLFE